MVRKTVRNVALTVFAAALMPVMSSASPSSPLQYQVDDDDFYVVLNGSNNDEYSATKWINNTVDALFQHEPFQQKLEALLEDMMDDPDTPQHDAILDTQMDLPLFGTINVGLHFQDIWDTGTGPCEIPNNTGNPNTCTNYAADGYGDNDVADQGPEFFTVDWDSTSAALSAKGGAYNANQSLPATTATNSPLNSGSLQLDITLGEVEADVILRQPDYPIYVTNGYYINAIGKMTVPSATLSVGVYAVGGNFAQAVLSGGYGIGIDIEGITFAGGIQLDLTEFDCGYTAGNSGGYQYANDAYGLCPVYTYLDGSWQWVLDPAHPSRTDSANGNNVATVRNYHTPLVNDASDFLAEVIKFIEGEVFIDAQQSSVSSIQDYLTAIEIYDTTWLTHERSASVITDSITFEHPIEEGAIAHIDYGFFFRFLSVDDGAIGPTAADGIVLPGGAAAAVVNYTNPNNLCNTIPGASSASPVIGSESGAGTDRISLSSAKLNQGDTAPMVGIAIHEDMINKLMHNLWSTPAMCMDLWKDSALLGSFLEDNFTIDQFSMFMPSLKPEYGDNDMMIRIRPSFQDLDGSAYVQADDQPMVKYEPNDPPKLLNAASAGLWDIQLEFPHLQTVFAGDTAGDGAYASFSDIFSADVAMSLYADVSYYAIGDVGDGDPAAPAGSGCEIAPYPCRMARAGIHFDPQVNAIKKLAGAATLLQADDLTRSLSSLMPLLLSGEYELQLEAAINTDPTDFNFLGVIIEPADIGTSNIDAGFGAVDGDNRDNDGNYATGADYFGFYGSIADMDNDGVADVFDPATIVDMLTEFGVFPAAPGFGSDAGPRVRAFDVDGPRLAAPETMLKVWNADSSMIGPNIELDTAQTVAMGIGPRGGTVFLANESSKYAREDLWVQYRLDKGLFSLPIKSDRIELPFLFDGHHTLEVWSFDEEAHMDATPAVMKFVVDTQAPRLKWVGAANVAEGSYQREIYVRDVVSQRENLAVSVRVNDGEWSAVEDTGMIQVNSLVGGVNTIEVRAVDENGNIRAIVDEISVADDGFGCATSRSGSPFAFGTMMLMMFIAIGAMRWSGRNEI